VKDYVKDLSGDIFQSRVARSSRMLQEDGRKALAVNTCAGGVNGLQEVVKMAFPPLVPGNCNAAPPGPSRVGSGLCERPGGSGGE
jgi:hypothetical protein